MKRLGSKEVGARFATKDVKLNPKNDIPYNFRVVEPPSQNIKNPANKSTSPQLTSSDNHGLRFPTLSSDDNFNYWKDSGFEKFAPKVFPFHLPSHRKLHPHLRELMHFLHEIDPHRFTTKKIAERYNISKRTAEKAISAWGTKAFLQRQQLVDLPFTPETPQDPSLQVLRAKRGVLTTRQISKNEYVLDRKEEMYARFSGYLRFGEGEEREEGEEGEKASLRPEEWGGWGKTGDFARLQYLQVEEMSAYPFGRFRSPMPKRVDVDAQVASTKDLKVINWINPTDKLVF